MLNRTVLMSNENKICWVPERGTRLSFALEPVEYDGSYVRMNFAETQFYAMLMNRLSRDARCRDGLALHPFVQSPARNSAITADDAAGAEGCCLGRAVKLTYVSSAASV